MSTRRGNHVSEKFYKVFVSSTYEDLKEERQEVFDALLKCNCFPVGMEHFPSSDWRSLDLIKKYINQCDYYVMVSAGIYGSIVPDQKISYVEWEYDYAKGRLPCYSFLFKNRDELRGDKLEKENPKLLDKFRKRVEGDHKNVNLYTSAAKLHSSVLHAFQRAPKDSPAAGWIRADDCSISNELIGAWKLIASNTPEWNGSTIIKVFSANEFMWVKVDRTGTRSFICGYYELDSYGTTIREVPRETNFVAIKGKPQEYQIEVTGNVLTTHGPRSTGVMVEEEFRRLDLSKGFDIMDNL